jgi:hypothetical protein
VKILIAVGLLIAFQLSYLMIEVVKFSIRADKRRKQKENRKDNTCQ